MTNIGPSKEYKNVKKYFATTYEFKSLLIFQGVHFI